MADSETVKQIRLAVASNDPAQIDALLASGVSVDARDEDEQTALYYACVHNRTKSALALLKAGADPNSVDKWGNAPLMYACSEGNVPLVKALLEAGADVTLRSAHSNTGLRSAVSGNLKGSREEHREIVQLLIEAGAPVDSEPPRPATVLMIAAADAIPETVQLLIDAGANVHTAKDMFGTALANAIAGNRPENVEVLLKAGADPNVRLSAEYREEKLAGKTLLEMAVKLKRKKIIPLLEAATGGSPGEASTTQKVPAVGQSWQLIEETLEKQNPELLASLAIPADKSELSALEKKLGTKLPDDFKEAYCLHNGQRDPHLSESLVPPFEGFDEGCILLNLDAIEVEWQQWLDNLEAGEFDEKGESDSGIRKDWWNRKWIPFAWDGGGNSLCLDLAPTKTGQRGQVITLSHESGCRRLLADSFAAWLADLARNLKESASSK